MKMNKFFSVMAMSAVLVSAFSCEKPGDPQTDDQGGQSSTLSTEAKISKFTAIIGDEQIEGKIFDSEKVVELPYLPAQFEALKSATAQIEVSKGATVSPDPSVEADYTVEGGVKFTVTAEDGKTTRAYTVELAAAEFQNKVEKVWHKTFGDMGVKTHKYADCGVAFSGTDFVTHDCQVFALDGTKKGMLNTEGLPNASSEDFELICMSNDVNGILFASAGVDADGGVPSEGDKIATGSIYAWFDGWENKPTMVIDGTATGANANLTRFFSVGGDANGQCILTQITPGRNVTTMHHCRQYNNGVLGEVKWDAFNVNLASNDGSWTQIVSPTSGDPNGVYIIGDSASNNEGYGAYVRHGINGKEDTPLYGTVLDDELAMRPEKPGQVKYQYGNYSDGHVRGFQYNGKDYVIVCSSGWPNAFVTIQPTDPNDDYLLRSQAFNTAAPRPVSAFVVDPETGNGIVIVSIEPGYEMVRYDIITEIM